MHKSFVLILLIPFLAFPQTKRAITVDDLWAMKRIGTYDVSPDGKTLAYTLTTYTFEANKGNTDIYLIDADGKNLRALINSDKHEGEQKEQAKEESKVKAEIFTELMYRHWNDWRGHKRSHLFLLDVATGNFTDLNESNKEDVSPKALGSANNYD